MIVVDDHLLLDALAGTISTQLQVVLASNDVATTLSWYYRLARAIGSVRTDGSLTRCFTDLTESKRAEIRRVLGQLPLSIAIVEARTAVPVMVGVTGATRSKLLTAEAVTTGPVLDADIAVGVESSLLREAAEIAHVVAHYVGQ